MNYDNTKPSIVYPKRVNDHCVSYESGYQEFQVFQYFGSGSFRMGSGSPALGVVCEGKVNGSGKEFTAGDSFLIEQWVDVETEAANVVICCENPSS